MVVIFIRLVYHDATLVRLELEVTDAVLLDVLHHIGKHRFDEVCPCIAIIAVLGAQTSTYIKDTPGAQWSYGDTCKMRHEKKRFVLRKRTLRLKI